MTLTCSGPAAGFSANQNLWTVNFSDSSASTAYSWFWDFGDGDTSSQQNPSHTYPASGTYTACLVVTDSCSTDSACQTLNVCPPPTATYSVSVNELVQSFTDNSGGSPNSWAWDFGDGNTSSTQSPTHTYASPGTYTVCLISTAPCGADTTCNSITVTCAAPVSDFSTSATFLSFSFSDQTTGGATTWDWFFGDGTTSTQQNPTHTYNGPGNYTVCLITSSQCGADTFCNTIAASCPAPVAAFSQSANELSVAFTDGSSPTPSGWFWDFGDGATSSLANPTHIYTQPGTYTTCLIATDSCGADTSCNTFSITCTAPTADFSFVVTGDSAAFSDFSPGNPTAWNWTFGDGTSSTQQNPSHSYSQSGTYQVCLTVSSVCGADTSCDSLNVTIVGRTENSPELGMELFPNPTSGILHLRFTERTTINSVELLDLQGRFLFPRVQNMAGGLRLDLAEFPPGLYLLEVQTGQGQFSRKIMLR